MTMEAGANVIKNGLFLKKTNYDLLLNSLIMCVLLQFRLNNCYDLIEV